MPETLLTRLSEMVEWPEADVAGGAGSRLATDRPAPPQSVPRWAAAALVVVVAAGVLVVSQGARQAVADLLGVVGIEVGFGDIDGGDLDLDLGRRVNLSEAEAAVDFEPLAPDRLGRPDEIYLAEGTPPILTSRWIGSDVLHTQFAASFDEPVLLKRLGRESDLRPVEVGEAAGIWIEGAPHRLMDDRGGPDQDARLAANVLAWNTGGVTHRLESTGTLEEALGLATLLRPLDE